MSTIPARRDALRRMAGLGLAALGAGLLPGCAAGPGGGAEALAQDPELARLVESIIGVDIHSHAAGAVGRSQPTYDLAARMRAGGITALCLAHSADSLVLRRDENNRVVTVRVPGPGELWQANLRRLRWFDQLVASQGFSRALRRGDLEAAHRAKTPAIVQTIEGAHFMEGKLERIADVYGRGVRHLQLVHFHQSDLGDNQTEPATLGGMTELGREAIAECNRLGIVVDVAHGTLAFVEAAAKASRTPLVLSHTAVAREVGPYARRITFEHARAVAATGGVVGIWANPYAFKSLGTYVDAVARAVDAAGAEHVGFGTDNSGFGARAAVWENYADFPLVIQQMRRHGFSPEEIRKIAGGNYVRVFDQSMRA